MEKFEKLYNTLDKATLYLKDILHNTYIDSLYINARSILEFDITVDIPENSKAELLKIYSEIDGLEMTKEEIRSSISFLTLKAFKEDNILNSETTADVACLLLAHVVNSIYKNQKGLSIIDPVVGSANLLTCVMNNLNPDGLEAIGFDINTTSIKLAQITADMQGNKVDFIIEDFIKSNIFGFDLAVFDSPLYIYDDEYFCHPLVSKLSKVVKDDGYLVGLIPNDFFEVSSDIKNEILENLSLIGIIALNENLFVDKKISKSIVIFKKSKNFKKEDVLVVNLPKINDYQMYRQALDQIKNYFR